MRAKYAPFFVFLVATFSTAQGQTPPAIPDDFPRFIVPGQEQAMENLRQLFYLHYTPSGPMATLWDEWLSSPTLWPAVETDHKMDSMRERWAAALSGRGMDAEGYVFTHQHASISHQEGWPFPFWKQGSPATWGWHFALPGMAKAWTGTDPKTQEGWQIHGGTDKGIANDTWNIDLTEPVASVTTPPLVFEADNSPFIQLRWRAKGLGKSQPYLDWTTEALKDFASERRFYFAPTEDAEHVIFTMIPVYKSPYWKGKITRLRLNFDNPVGASVGIQSLFNQYDTRHNINNANFIRGCCKYFWWTNDLNFLRSNIERMRLAMAYQMDELGGMKEKCILTPWVGHDGRSGIEITGERKKILHPGRGIGADYWDLLPMGQRDCYATIQYYDSINTLAKLEEELARHPEWNIPGGPLRRDAADLRHHAEEVKATAGKLFWNPTTGRFVSGIDSEGKSHDYGFTFVNLEAITYGLATDDQAKSIMSWIAGERTVDGDTSTGGDIYHWRFGPRATTKRNIDYYLWAWSGPESIPWGGQVQDGGAVMGFTHYDLMSRLRTRGPDDAWARLREIASWFGEVQAAGGYRKYYTGGERGTMQGGGTAGGLGLDQEFFESILAPQIMIEGFLGFHPRGDGFELNPRLPKDWSKLTANRIHWHNLVMAITVEGKSIKFDYKGRAEEEILCYLRPGEYGLWSMVPSTGKMGMSRQRVTSVGDGIHLDLGEYLVEQIDRLPD